MRTGMLRAATLVAVGLLLPGCPLSDEYYVEGAAGQPVKRPPMRGGDGGRTAMSMDLPPYCAAERYSDHTYLLCLPPGPERLNHLDASKRCVGLADAAGVAAGSIMDLVVVGSDDENQFVVDWIKSATNERGLVWMGATDVVSERTWVWGRAAGTTQFFTQDKDGGGAPYMDSYNDFADKRPDGTNDDDQDCGAFDSSLEWEWDDERCAEQALGFICEEVSP